MALASLVFIASTHVLAEDADEEIRGALTAWTEDFNNRRADKICDLFASDLLADFRGQPERNYAEVCALLKRSLADGGFSYALDIQEILVAGDIAVVRLIWTLTIKDKTGAETVSVEPGLDIFQKRENGKWQIIRYMAYEQ